MRKVALTVALAGLALSVAGQEISLKATPASFRVLPGAPIEFQLSATNISGKPLTLVGESLNRALTPQGGLLRDASDKPITCSPETTSATVTSGRPPCDGPKVIFPRETVMETTFGIYSQRSCPLREVVPGEYMGQLWIEAQVCEGGHLRIIRQTLSIPITVEEPRGEDAAYLDALEKAVIKAGPRFSGPYGGALKWMEVLHSPRVHPEQVALSTFSTSTYAASMVYARMAGFARQDPAAILGTIEGGMFNSNSYPDETGQSKDGWRWLKGKENADWWSKWYDIILKNHPDIWFADELRLKKAFDKIALKNYQGAEADLKALAGDSKSPMCDRAALILGLMKQKGWTKDGSAPPAQQPPVARGQSLSR